MNAHTYRAGNAIGAPAGEPLGIGHYNAMLALDSRIADLEAEERRVSSALANSNDANAVNALASQRRELQDKLREAREGRTTEAARREAVRNAAMTPTGLDDIMAAAMDNPAAAARAARQFAGVHETPNGSRYAEMFGTAPTREGWSSFDQFLDAIRSGRHHPNLISAATGMSETVGSEGGFLVPGEFAADLLDGSLEDEIVRPRATIVPMRSNTKRIAKFDESTHASGTIHGVTAAWAAELATQSDQKLKFAYTTLNAQKLLAFAQPSNELLEDGDSIAQQVGDGLKGAVGFKLDYAFFNGSGAGQPNGIFNDPALITVNKESGQAADTIVFENLANMMARLYPGGFGRSVWVASQTTLPQLMQLVIPVGTGGQVIPVLSGQDGKFTILTRPVVFTEKVPVVGDVGDISLIDFSQYAVGLRREVTVESSMGPGWYQDANSFRAVVRVDGRGRWAGPITPAKGSTTLSWAVTLQAR